jgi:uncharacterized membrane protein
LRAPPITLGVQNTDCKWLFFRLLFFRNPFHIFRGIPSKIGLKDVTKLTHISRKFSFVFAGTLLLCMGYSSLNLNTTSMFLVSTFMLLTCFASAIHLFGIRSALVFLVGTLVIGFFAEYMGENYGWFFGDYDFTEVLGFKFLGVPIIIPMMWFSLSYIGLILAFLLSERRPFQQQMTWAGITATSALGALLVTAYDLGADPYMVFEVKAWIMEKKDGWWFGETVQGFVGWFGISFTILFLFQFFMRFQKWSFPKSFKLWDTLIIVLIYASLMFYQILYGVPVETRTISVFAMGIPLFIAILGMKHWNQFKN